MLRMHPRHCLSKLTLSFIALRMVESCYDLRALAAAQGQQAETAQHKKVKVRMVGIVEDDWVLI